MLEFIVNYWYIFAIVAGVLVLGLIGYIVDRKKYDQYRDEILHENGLDNSLTQSANVSEVADVIQVEEQPVQTPVEQPVVEQPTQEINQ